MANISEIKQNLDLLEYDGRRFYLVGTAHVSKASADLVEATIREHSPDTVCLELCEARLQSISNPNRWSNTDIYEIVKSGKAYVLLAQLLLGSFQKRIAKKFGIDAGEEMLRALAVTKETGAELAVIDRDVRITLKRAWGKAGFWSMTKLFASLFVSFFSEEDISEETIEDLKSGDTLMVVMKDFADVLPGVKDALIDERDRYMATKILQAPGQTVVAVVGAGHCPGIKAAFGELSDLAALEEIPPKSKVLTAVAWGIPTIIIAMFIYGFTTSGLDTGKEILLTWFLANGVLAAIGAAIALAHPLTILSAFFAAPLTSLNPTVGAGWVCGLVEAIMRKPRVKDLETISEDVATLGGFWKNRVSKILLVMALANVGSVIGTFVGAGKIATLL